MMITLILRDGSRLRLFDPHDWRVKEYALKLYDNTIVAGYIISETIFAQEQSENGQTRKEPTQ